MQKISLDTLCFISPITLIIEIGFKQKSPRPGTMPTGRWVTGAWVETRAAKRIVKSKDLINIFVEFFTTKYFPRGSIRNAPGLIGHAFGPGRVFGLEKFEFFRRGEFLKFGFLVIRDSVRITDTKVKLFPLNGGGVVTIRLLEIFNGQRNHLRTSGLEKSFVFEN